MWAFGMWFFAFHWETAEGSTSQSAANALVPPNCSTIRDTFVIGANLSMLQRRLQHA